MYSKVTSIFFFICLLVLPTKGFTQPITIFTIGDSTMADKPLDNDNQERGWGQMLPQLLDNKYVIVENHAKNGRSSKSFIDEGLWDIVLSKVNKGDYVFIQFGHNDEKVDEKRSTIPGSSFDDNLRRFVIETREKGATPVLFNSIVRRKFNQDGMLIDTHGDYTKSPELVGNQLNVPFVDLNKQTHNLIQQLGDEPSKELFMWVGDKQDDTHLNIKGAYIVAKLAIQQISEKIPSLSQYIQWEKASTTL